MRFHRREGLLMIRTPGLRGRLPKLADADRLPLKYLHEYAPAPLPAPVYPIDVSENITDWLMCGNGPDTSCTSHPDGVGDCTYAARQHYRMAKAARAQKTETWETSDQLVAEYLTYNHGQDVGANIAQLLLAWYRTGKILAFAPVDHTDPALVDSAMALFTGVYAGVQLTDNCDDLFSQGLPWTVADGEQPDPSEGHCILKVSANGTMDRYVTWGANQLATADWTAACLDEAWVVITTEDEGAKLIDLALLQNDIKALTG
jgi:hypothetical protein